MTLEEVVGKYMRLRAELQAVLDSLRPREAHIERLSADIASLEAVIVRMQPEDEQTSELMPYVSPAASR